MRNLHNKIRRVVEVTALIGALFLTSGCSASSTPQGDSTGKDDSAKTISESLAILDGDGELTGDTDEPEESADVSEATKGKLIAIDAGHQSKGNYSKEPIGPGATKTKYKVAGGTKGVASGLYEYELTLEVSLQLQEELESRGYEVLMIRTENDVDISNSERAIMANEAGVDAFIRLHANGCDTSSVHGAMTICQTESNPYNGELAAESKLLSEDVLDAYVAKTECHKEYVWETDSMSGINWCQVPVTIIELGYMSNREEDLLMATEDYQRLMAEGMADGIDAYFADLTAMELKCSVLTGANAGVDI